MKVLCVKLHQNLLKASMMLFRAYEDSDLHMIQSESNVCVVKVK
jgi:hypothetical protein